MNDISYFLFGVVGGLGVSTLARYSALTPSPRRSSASALSGSANRGDFSRIMQLEVVDSHNALPLVCCLLLRLFRFGFDFVFWLKFVCSG